MPNQDLTIFILFFGVSVLDAFRSGDLVRAGFWFVIGLVFWTADRFTKAQRSAEKRPDHLG